jgi:hypothetical protein
MAQTESSTLSFRLPDAAAGDRPRYAGMNVERPPLLAAIGRFGSGTLLHFAAMSDGWMTNTGPSCGGCAPLSRHLVSTCFNADIRPEPVLRFALKLTSG